ncbi:hypothetical protein MRX96_032580 [Rhipicephalus microplus]
MSELMTDPSSCFCPGDDESGGQPRRIPLLPVRKKAAALAGQKQIWIGHCSSVKTPAFYHTAGLAGLAVKMTLKALASSKPPSSTVPKNNSTSQRLLAAA